MAPPNSTQCATLPGLVCPSTPGDLPHTLGDDLDLPDINTGVIGLPELPVRDNPNPPSRSSFSSSYSLPRFILEKLFNSKLQLPKLFSGDRPTPPQNVLAINNQTGLLNISTEYRETIRRGHQALRNVKLLLEKVPSTTDAKELVGLYTQIANELTIYARAATMVRDVHTNYGFNIYTTIERWVDKLWTLQREHKAKGFSLDSPLRLEGVVLGFNLQAINGHDSDLRTGTGTAVKYLIPYFAHQVAKEWYGTQIAENKRASGVLETNSFVEGIPADKVEPFRAEVLRRTLTFLSVDQLLPDAVAKAMGTPGRRTSDLKARDWLVSNPDNISLKAGHAAIEKTWGDIRPGHVEGAVTEVIEKASEAEMHARAMGKDSVVGKLPANSPAIGRGKLRLLRSPRVLPKGSDLRKLNPINAADFHRGDHITPEDVRSGLLPSPRREVRDLTFRYVRLMRLTQKARKLAKEGNIKASQKIQEQILKEFPQMAGSPGQEKSVELEKGKIRSIQQPRFLGVFRLDQLPQFLSEMFQGKAFYGQMTEYADYKGHNMGNPADKQDTVHRLTIDVSTETYRSSHVEVHVATNGGDEIFYFYGTHTTDGRRLTSQDLANLSHQLTSNFNYAFINVPHHLMEKVPTLREGQTGIFQNRPYILAKDGTVYISKKPKNSKQMAALLQTVELAFGRKVKPKQVKKLKIVNQFVQIERRYAAVRTDSSGRTVEIRTQTPEAPPGFQSKVVPLRTTTTSAHLFPAQGSPEVIAQGLIHIGKQASDMKSQGVDRPKGFSSEASSVQPVPTPENEPRIADEIQRAQKSVKEGPPAQIKLSLMERLNATQRGRNILNFGTFVLGDVASEGIMQFHNGSQRLSSLDFYQQLVTGYVTMHLGTMAGQNLTGKVTSNATVKHAGGMLGAILLSEISQGRLDLEEVGKQGLTMAAAMAPRGMIHGGQKIYSTFKGKAPTGGIRPAGGGGHWGALLAQLALAVGEMVIMKMIGHWRQTNALSDHEQKLTYTLAQRMRGLDYLIASGASRDSAGKIRPDSLIPIKNILNETIEAFRELLIFRFGQSTPEGKKLWEAQGKLQVRLDPFLKTLKSAAKEFPEVKLIIQQLEEDPVKGWEKFTQFVTSNPKAGLHIESEHFVEGGMFWSQYLAILVRDYNKAQIAFKTMVQNRLENAPYSEMKIALHLKGEGQLERLVPQDPNLLPNFLMNFLSSRTQYSARLNFESDRVALQRHYPPSPGTRLLKQNHCRSTQVHPAVKSKFENFSALFR